MPRLPVLALVLSSLATHAHAQSAENVAVIVNEASPASKRIGAHYVRARDIPSENVIRITTTTDEHIALADYARTIEGPIVQALNRGGLQDRVLYIVVTKGVPLRIRGTAGRTGTSASVDSELTLLYRRLTGTPITLAGPIQNPYYMAARPIRDARPFTHRDHDIYLVTRLDGFSVEDAMALVDRAQKPELEGRVVLDQRSASSDATGDVWLRQAAVRLHDLGQGARVVLEDSPQPARVADGVLGYYSWGSNDPQHRARRVGVRFVPGAIAATFLSADARTLQPPPDDWVPADQASPKSGWYAGSPQALAGDLIREGVTGLAANVSEPYIDGAVRPDILFPAYLAGFNLAEAFYLALPYLSWQTVILGDPLCAPFRRSTLTRAAIEDPIDAATELPGVFSKRRMEIVGRTLPGTPPSATALMVRADNRLNRGDVDGALNAMEEAAALAPEAASVHLQLALLYERRGEPIKAIESYRRVVDVQPDNVIALNNLAYRLAVDAHAPEEALIVARRAIKLAPGSPAVIDTLAWIEHLRGRHEEAARLMTRAIQKNTGNAEIHLHAAIIFAAAGDMPLAEAQLQEALRLNPDVAERDEARALRKRLGDGR